MSVIDASARGNGYTFAPKIVMTSHEDVAVGEAAMSQAEIVRRLAECLAVYDRVLHPVASDPVRQALEDLLIAMSSSDFPSSPKESES
jgi:hypothetical protein